MIAYTFNSFSSYHFNYDYSVRLGNLRLDMWFHHDEHRLHLSISTRQHLNRIFGERWIGLGEPIE